MFHKEMLEKLRAEASGERALEYILKFWPHDRLSTFPGYHRAAEVTAGIMEDLGLEDVEIIRYETTGKNLFGDWEGPQGWDAISGYLDVTPEKGKTRRIADRQSDPCNLMLWCGSTPEEGVETTIVRADTEGDIEGKLLFQDNVALDDKLRRRAIEGGALGVISDELPCWPDVREREENMHVVRWHNAFLFPANEENLLAFSIAPVHGDWLRGLLAGGREVKAFTKVKTRLYDTYLPVTTGVVRGKVEPEKEIWMNQHLHEVGAHDNASGVGVSLEAARAIRELVDRSRIDPPGRTIRVICSWEVIGFLAHLSARPEIAENVVCAINPDMAGPRQDVCNSWLQVFINPESRPHFSDDLLLDLVREVYRKHPRWHWEKQKFIINDNFLADPTIGIPCPSIIFMRDRYYHSSSDRPENLDPKVMTETGAIMAAGSYTLAAGGVKSALELADITLAGCLEELAEVMGEKKESRDYDERLQYLVPVLKGRLRSLTDMVIEGEDTGELEEKIEAAIERLGKVAEAGRPSGSERFSLEPRTESEKEAAGLVPVRKVRGSLSLARVPREVKQERGLEKFSSWSYDDNLPLFWADGKRSIFEIQWLVGQESGKKPQTGKLLTLFRTLEEFGYVELKNGGK